MKYTQKKKIIPKRKNILKQKTTFEEKNLCVCFIFSNSWLSCKRQERIGRWGGGEDGRMDGRIPASRQKRRERSAVSFGCHHRRLLLQGEGEEVFQKAEPYFAPGPSLPTGHPRPPSPPKKKRRENKTKIPTEMWQINKINNRKKEQDDGIMCA